MLFQVLVFSFLLSNAFARYMPCKPKDFGHGSVVCVCSSSYCDGFIKMPTLMKGEYLVYTSTKSGRRFMESRKKISEKRSNLIADVVISIHASDKQQQVLGFGGAFTDVTSINIHKMASGLRKQLYQSYFSDYGIQYTIGRIPMAATDFSTRAYSYDDYPGDFQLRNFSLAVEDYKYKIPVIKKALKMSKKMKLYGSPWSAPGWMKTSNSMVEGGTLRAAAGQKYYKTWANYFVRFLKAYESVGIPRLWGLTVQNEPQFLADKSFLLPHMALTADQEKDFIAKDLGPALEAHGYQDVNLMMFDDMRTNLQNWTYILDHPEAKKYIKGVALHWYYDNVKSPKILDKLHYRHPDVFILGTEASIGTKEVKKGVVLGAWERGEQYSHDIMQNLNHWMVGWTDWNMVLDMKAGPNIFKKSYLDAAVIFDEENKVFYKQPMFYHTGHFSRFIPPGSFHITALASSHTSLEFAAFQRPDSLIAIVVLNRGREDVTFAIKNPGQQTLHERIIGRSIKSYLISYPNNV